MMDSAEDVDDFRGIYLTENDTKTITDESLGHCQYDNLNKLALGKTGKNSKFGNSYLTNMAINRGNLIAVSTNFSQNAILNLTTLDIIKQSNADRFSKSDLITDLTFSKTSPHLLFTSSTDNSIRCYDLRETLSSGSTAKSSMTYTVSKTTDQNIPFLCLDINRSDSLLGAGTEAIDENVYTLFWDVRKSKSLGAYWNSHTEDIVQVKFSEEEENMLLTGSLDGLVNVFDVAEYTEDDALQQTNNINSSVEKIHWIGKNEYICITNDSNLQYWKYDEAAPVFTVTRTDVAAAFKNRSSVQQMIDCFKSPDSSSLLLITGNSTGVVHLSDINIDGSVTGRSILQGHHSALVRCTEMNRQNGQLLTCGEDGMICQWKQKS